MMADIPNTIDNDPVGRKHRMTLAYGFIVVVGSGGGGRGGDGPNAPLRISEPHLRLHNISQCSSF